MLQQKVGIYSPLRAVVAVATTFAMTLGIAAPVFAADTATFTGAVLNPENAPAVGCTVIFKDVATGQELKSAPTGPNGEYQVSVPVGGRYKLDSVLAPDGTKLQVQDIPPMPVRVAGSTRLDVKFLSGSAGGAAAAGTLAAADAGTTTTTEAETDQKKKDKGGVPWWKTPGGITGIVLGSVAVLALALSAGGSNNNASPSQ